MQQADIPEVPGHTEPLAVPLPVPLSRVRIVLASPSHPGNVGSVARAMKTMGLSQLFLVTPRHPAALSHADAHAMASGAGDVLQAARICNSLDEALSGCVWSVALTARDRAIAPLRLEPQAAARQALDLASQGKSVALVFGNEQHGLDNADVLRCQACCSIPTSLESTSLNLAQAVQVLAYECQLASRVDHAKAGHTSLPARSASPSPPSVPEVSELASIEEREQLFEHLRLAMLHLQFTHPDRPGRLMERLRRMFARSGLEKEEVNILRGLCSSMLEATPPRPHPVAAASKEEKAP